MLHHVLYVNQKIYDDLYNKNKLSPFCNNCKTKRETILPGLYECTDKCKVWKHFLQTINKLNNAMKMTSTNCVLILNALVKDQKVTKKVTKLLLTIHITILNEIWKARNLKHHNKTLTTQQIFQRRCNLAFRLIWYCDVAQRWINIKTMLLLPSKYFNVVSTLFSGWYDITTLHNVELTFKQCCVRERWSFQHRINIDLKNVETTL